jgi:DNA-binding beta-propeller fold protein YncE
VLGCAAVCAPGAQAAVGNLSFTGCIGQLTLCTPTSPDTAVNEPSGVAVSPDGKSVYVGSGTAVDEFSRDAGTGALTFTGCIGQVPGCTLTTPGDAVYGAESVVVSPDGRSVYVASYVSNVVDEFSRDTTTGALMFTGCIGEDSGCTPTTPSDVLGSAFSVAISPDGASVYVAATTYGIDAFSRNPSTGALTFTGCVGQGSACTPTTPTNAVSSPVSVVVSPDGANVYAGSNIGSGVDVFSRNTTTGALSFDNCIGVTAGCTAISPSGALNQSYAVAVSPDGANVYSVDGGSPGVLSTFTRASGTGALTFSGCVGQLAGCATPTPTGAVYDPVAVAVSSDGASVYVAADDANSVDVLSRATSGGALTFTGCVGQLQPGCAATTPAAAVGGPSGIAISPDGASVYTDSTDSNDVDVFSRVTPPPPSPLTLAVTLNGTGSGSVAGSGIACPGTCASSYTSGTAVSLTATPAAGSTFVGWSGACSGTGACNLTMTTNQAVTATFEKARPHCTLVPVSDKVFVPRHERKHPKTGQGTLRLTAKCDQSTEATLHGTVTELLGRKHGRRTTKSFKLATLHTSLSAGVAKVLSMKVPDAVVRALEHRERESAAFTLSATDLGGTVQVAAKIPALKL